MSAASRNYVYRVVLDKKKDKPEPTVSRETLEQYKKDIENLVKKQVKDRDGIELLRNLY